MGLIGLMSPTRTPGSVVLYADSIHFFDTRVVRFVVFYYKIVALM